MILSNFSQKQRKHVKCMEIDFKMMLWSKFTHKISTKIAYCATKI